MPRFWVTVTTSAAEGRGGGPATHDSADMSRIVIVSGHILLLVTCVVVNLKGLTGRVHLKTERPWPQLSGCGLCGHMCTAVVQPEEDRDMTSYCFRVKFGWTSSAPNHDSVT